MPHGIAHLGDRRGRLAVVVWGMEDTTVTILCEVRTMPCDVVCSVCKGQTRNACVQKVKGRVKVSSFVCDSCLGKLPMLKIVKK